MCFQLDLGHLALSSAGLFISLSRVHVSGVCEVLFVANGLTVGTVAQEFAQV